MNQDQSTPVRVRFAPSPTGKLHIGGARTAIYNWAFARATGGTFVLRIEDTDPERSTEENTQIILRTLRWLELDWDEGPEIGGDAGPYFQTQRTASYHQALDTLKERDAVYACFCSKLDLDSQRELAEKAEGGYAGYDRTCRSLSKKQVSVRIAAGEPHVWRLKVPLNHSAITFNDAVYGQVSFPADVMDDMILVRSDGTPTYNFAVVCDDANMNITHVIRGDDHLSNTPRQILIYEALGLPIPTFAHLSMILGPDGKKLSKRHGASSVEEFHDKGFLPDTMVNFLALLGWSLDGETTIINRAELTSQFSLTRVTKKDAVFDEKKLEWMNGIYIRNLTASCWVNLSRQWLVLAGASDSDIDMRRSWFEKLYPLVAERLVRFDEIPEKLAFLFWGSHVTLDEKSKEKVLLKEGARAKEALIACRGVISDTTIDWLSEPLQDACMRLCETMDIKAKLLLQPLRVAVCGNMVSPPLFESMELMSREDVLLRIDQTLKEVFSV